MAYEPPSSYPFLLYPSSSFFYPSSSPYLLNSSVLNGSVSPAPTLLALGLSSFTMALGVLSNLTALGILARSSARFRRRTKAPFLFLTGSLLLTDLAGHLIPGALALHLHLVRGQSRTGPGQDPEPARVLCQLFGACMVFFGLCPLFLGGAMAVERCLGITRPLFHSTVVTTTHARLAVALLGSLALLLAMLPLLAVGSYAPQFPGTWCFLPLHGPLSAADTSLALAFSGLGLVALVLSLFCNTLSGVALLKARLASWGSQSAHGRARKNHHMLRARSSSSSSSMRSLEVEMMVQLAGITVVSCVCWTPFLVLIALSAVQFNSSPGRSGVDRDGSHRGAHPYERQLLLSLRLASWNQILDPWVYILLRRVVMRTLYQLLQSEPSTTTHGSSCTGSSRQSSGTERLYTDTGGRSTETPKQNTDTDTGRKSNH